jgi:virulence factor Mce-like protein
MRRVKQPRLSYFQAGLITLVLLGIGVYLGFTKSIPFRHHYELKAVFKTANNVRPNSPVRIAGVNIGKVTGVKHLTKGEPEAQVTMRIDKLGLPIHKDAVMSIRPRIFLEGNFFVDVQPGTPSAPTVGDGDMIPVQQTKSPVQFDQILTALQSDTRDDLKILLREYARGLDGRGGLGFQRSIPYWKPAYRDSAVVNQATLGLLEHDLSNYIDSAGATAEAIDADPAALKNLITDFNTTALAFAREQGNLEATVAELPRTLRAAQPALKALNSALPPTRRLAKDFLPGVKSSGPTIDASRPLVRQLRLLVSGAELRGLAADLRATIPSLGSLQDESVPLYEQVRPASSCQNQVILPWSNDKIEDPNFPATGPVYQESVKYLPGISGESRSGDANNQWFRVLLNSGNYATTNGAGGVFLTNNPIGGVNPPKPVDSAGNTRRPPLRPDVPCETQQPPDLQTDPAAPPSSRKVNTTSAAAQKLRRKAILRNIRKYSKSLKKLGIGMTTKDATREQVLANAGKKSR